MTILAFMAGVLSALVGCVIGILPARLFTGDRYSHFPTRLTPPPISLGYDIVASAGMALGTGVAVMLSNWLLSSHYDGSLVYVGGFAGLFVLVKRSVNGFRSVVVASAVFGIVVGSLEKFAR